MYIFGPRAVSLENKTVFRAGSPGYIFVPRAVSPMYIFGPRAVSPEYKTVLQGCQH